MSHLLLAIECIGAKGMHCSDHLIAYLKIAIIGEISLDCVQQELVTQANQKAKQMKQYSIHLVQESISTKLRNWETYDHFLN